MNKCLRCGAATQPDAKFCSKCGQPVKQTTSSLSKPATPAPQPTLKSRTRTHTSAGTRQLSTPLPDQGRMANGARLQNDRYEVVVCLEENATRNRYVVRDLQAQRCAQCRREDTVDAKFCERCGVPLTETFYLLLEGLQPAVLGREANVQRLHLQHPSLINFYQMFTDQPVGNRVRTYLVLDPVTVEQEALGAQKATRLASLAAIAPQQAIAWLNDLVQTVDYLHSKQVWLPDLNRQQLLLVGQQIRLTGLEGIKAFQPTEAAMVAAQEVRLFVQLWQELIGTRSLPVTVAEVLQRAQNPQNYPTPQAFMAALTSGLLSPQPAAQAIQLQVGSLSDLGLVREINEDSLVILAVDQSLNSSNLPIRLYAVADGMGGHAAGETASKLALTQLSQTLLTSIQQSVANSDQPPLLDHANLLKQACLQAAKTVYDQARQRNVDMGTTLVAALIDLANGNAYIANIGDSRLYKISRAGITQITRDHSMVQLLVEKQQLTPAQARSHPQANLIYRTLGEKPVVEVDIFREVLTGGDIVLLCSDGLSGQVPDLQIHNAIVNSTTPQTACAELVRLARTTGGPDNITAIVIQVERANAIHSNV